MASPTRLSWLSIVALTAATVVVAALSGLLLRHGCTHMPPPLDVHRPPDPGTPRAAYCDATNRSQPWLAAALAAALCGAVLPPLRRRHPSWSTGTASVLCVAFLAAGATAGMLDAALTI